MSALLGDFRRFCFAFQSHNPALLPFHAVDAHDDQDDDHHEEYDDEHNDRDNVGRLSHVGVSFDFDDLYFRFQRTVLGYAVFGFDNRAKRRESEELPTAKQTDRVSCLVVEVENGKTGGVRTLSSRRAKDLCAFVVYDRHRVDASVLDEQKS